MSYNNNRLASNNELIGGGDIEKETAAGISDLFFKAGLFVFVFILLFLNLIAVSLSLQCNEGRDMPFKIASALFAFMFGFIYIIINYFLYKINVRKWPCILNANDPFFFMSQNTENKSESSKASKASVVPTASTPSVSKRTATPTRRAAPVTPPNTNNYDDEFD